MMRAMDRRAVMLGLAGGAMAAATGAQARAAPSIIEVSAQARRLYRHALSVNGNIVAPIDPDGPLDPPLARQVRSSGVTALKLTLGGPGNQTKAQVLEDIAATDRGIAASGGLYMRIRSVADLAVAKSKGRVGIIYSFEASEMLEGDLDNIDLFAAQDVRIMGLSYNVTTPFGSGVLSKVSTGLTPLGAEAVRRMNALGVSLDVSHSDEASSLSAIAVSARPALITHAGCDAVRAHPRNKSDRLLKALADRGGVAGIYELAFLAPEPDQPTLEVYMAHLVHALNVCGEDHVGIGSDALLTPFDTSPEAMARWNEDIARRKASGVGAPGEGPPPFVIGLNRPDRMAVIVDALLKRGYRARVAEKVLGGNFRRAFAETWTKAS